jgi:hypothetical protein
MTPAYATLMSLGVPEKLFLRRWLARDAAQRNSGGGIAPAAISSLIKMSVSVVNAL